MVRAMISRRRFLVGAAGAAGATWLPVGRVVAGANETPPGFPSSIELFRQRFQNWSKEIVVDDLWTFRPTSAAEVAEVATWAAGHGWRVRPRGAMHGWSPFTVSPDPSGSEVRSVVLADTTGLDGIEAVAGGARVGAGVRLLDLLTHLEDRQLGLTSVPAVGDVTVGGMLAIGAHGAAIPAVGEDTGSRNFGSVSHAVRELTAVVWDGDAGRYVARTFRRGDRELPALVCSLGRAFVTEVVLDASPLRYVRCRSHVHIPATELFAPGGSRGRTMASFLDRTGRAEALWYPFTDKPWLKVWEVSPSRPLTSRPTLGPYNYPFSDQIPEELADLATSLITGTPGSTPLFGQLTYAVTAAGLAATASYDLWGPAKDTQLYIQATTLRVGELGLAVMTSRLRIQETIHLLATKWSDMVAAAASRGEYPINMPLEIRATGLDGSLGSPPILAATSPDPSAPHFDVVLFTNLLTLTGTAGSDAFFTEYERFVRGLDPALARLRPEWSKNVAYTGDGPGSDPVALEEIRDRFRAGRPRPDSWDGAAATFARLDRKGVFTNPFLDELFQR